MNYTNLIGSFEESYEITLPTRWVVCDRCRGEGAVALPGIAFTESDMAEDPDFFDDYRSGVYDQQCPDCAGRTTIKQVDTDALTPELLREWWEWVAEWHNTEHLYRMERAMGA